MTVADAALEWSGGAVSVALRPTSVNIIELSNQQSTANQFELNKSNVDIKSLSQLVDSGRGDQHLLKDVVVAIKDQLTIRMYNF